MALIQVRRDYASALSKADGRLSDAYILKGKLTGLVDGLHVTCEGQRQGTWKILLVTELNKKRTQGRFCTSSVQDAKEPSEQTGGVGS